MVETNSTPFLSRLVERMVKNSVRFGLFWKVSVVTPYEWKLAVSGSWATQSRAEEGKRENRRLLQAAGGRRMREGGGGEGGRGAPPEVRLRGMLQLSASVGLRRFPPPMKEARSWKPRHVPHTGEKSPAPLAW